MTSAGTSVGMSPAPESASPDAPVGRATTLPEPRRVEGRHDGRAAQPELGGQGALARQPGADEQAAVGHEPPNGVGEAAVGRPGERVRAETERMGPLSHDWPLTNGPIMATMVAMRRHVPLRNLGPLAQLRAPHLPRRIVQLLVGLTLYGVSM